MVYCQIIKQSTGNRKHLSREKGWQAMRLATRLLACSQQQMKDLSQRLQKTLRHGQRKYQPHQVEAIQHTTTHIFCKVYFPDDSAELWLVCLHLRADGAFPAKTVNLLPGLTKLPSDILQQ